MLNCRFEYVRTKTTKASCIYHKAIINILLHTVYDIHQNRHKASAAAHNAHIRHGLTTFSLFFLMSANLILKHQVSH